MESAESCETLRLKVDAREEQTVVPGHADDRFASPARADEVNERARGQLNTTSAVQNYSSTIVPAEGIRTPAVWTKPGSTAATIDRDDKKLSVDEQQPPLPQPARIK
jgi:hypothetical protein